MCPSVGGHYLYTFGILTWDAYEIRATPELMYYMSVIFPHLSQTFVDTAKDGHLRQQGKKWVINGSPGDQLTAT